MSLWLRALVRYHQLTPSSLPHHTHTHTTQVVPWDFDVNSEKWDGLFYSNGPGDPSMAAPTIKYLKEAIKVHMPSKHAFLRSAVLSSAVQRSVFFLPFIRNV